MKKILKREEGQALVEFALVLPILLLIVCGIMDFGWVFYNYLSLQNACREGARYACVNVGSATDMTTFNNQVFAKVKENVPGNLQEHDAALSAVSTYTDTSNPLEGDVVVETSAKVRFLTPILGSVLGDNQMTLTSKVTMKVES